MLLQDGVGDGGCGGDDAAGVVEDGEATVPLASGVHHMAAVGLRGSFDELVPPTQCAGHGVRRRLAQLRGADDVGEEEGHYN